MLLLPPAILRRAPYDASETFARQGVAAAEVISLGRLRQRPPIGKYLKAVRGTKPGPKDDVPVTAACCAACKGAVRWLQDSALPQRREGEAAEATAAPAGRKTLEAVSGAERIADALALVASEAERAQVLALYTCLALTLNSSVIQDCPSQGASYPS